MLTRKQQYRRAVAKRTIQCHPADVVEFGQPRFLGTFKGKDSLDRLGDAARQRREDSPSSQGEDCIPGRSGKRTTGVRFSCRISVVLVPTRKELTEARREMWWSDEDYAAMRRAYIDQSRAEALSKQLANYTSSKRPTLGEGEESGGGAGAGAEVLPAPQTPLIVTEFISRPMEPAALFPQGTCGQAAAAALPGLSGCQFVL